MLYFTGSSEIFLSPLLRCNQSILTNFKKKKYWHETRLFLWRMSLHFLSVPILNKIKNLPKNVLLLHFILNYKTFRNFSYLNENSLWKIIPIIILIIINLVQLYLNVKQQLTGAIWKKGDQASILFFWNAVLRTYLQRIITICTLNQNSNQNMFDTLICFNRFFSHLLFWKVVLDKEQKLGWKNMK